MVAQMLEGAGRYFLSRPRRFGKSLLLDTMKSIFEGRKALFEGLYLESRWDWQKSWPVIQIDLANAGVHSLEVLDDWLHQQLDENQQALNLDVDHHTNPAIRFTRLIQEAAKQSQQQQVVILIDEYDKPILDNIEHLEQATAVREVLKSFYSVIKGQDRHIRFIFMTGVTNLSKVSLFSGINQIKDITLDKRYATLCGYTEQDLKTEFSQHLSGVNWQKLEDWYNGYHFCGEAVYNPYDILLFINKDHAYRNYWFETGSPSFLLKLFKQQQYFLPELENVDVGEEILDSFDIERIDPTTLLFQAGYLTIDSVINDEIFGPSYQLKIPNQEVRTALNSHFIQAYTELTSTSMKWRKRLYQLLNSGDLNKLEQEITRLFSSIPWRNFTHNDLPNAEGYYASVLYAFFASLNATIIPEDINNHGQADMTIMLGNNIYVMEFKRDTSKDYQLKTPNPALQHIQQQGYAEKYKQQGEQVFEVGMIFNTHIRNLVQFDWQALD